MDNSVLEDEILKTLSFLEPMGLDSIFLDLDKNFVTAHPEITYEDVLAILVSLTKAKKIKMLKTDGHKKWIKVFPKKSLLTRFFNKILK